MSVDADWRRVNRPVYTVPDYVDVNVLQGASQAQWRSNFHSQRGNVVGVDCGTRVVGGQASAFQSGVAGYTDFAGEVTVGGRPRPFLLVLSPLGAP